MGVCVGEALGKNVVKLALGDAVGEGDGLAVVTVAVIVCEVG